MSDSIRETRIQKVVYYLTNGETISVGEDIVLDVVDVIDYKYHKRCLVWSLQDYGSRLFLMRVEEEKE